MMSLDLPLPELTDSSRENFVRAWTRFELVATAKEWNTAKQLAILPTLLRGKLVDFYTELDDETKQDLQLMKSALMKRAGFQSDPLVAGKSFMSCAQQPNERVEDFANRLRKLFRQAYEREEITSDVLLQRFIMGLLAPISRQLLVEGKPQSWEEALKGAVRIEYALGFESTQVPPARTEGTVANDACHSVQDKSDVTPPLCQTVEEIARRLESLEACIKQNQYQRPTSSSHRPNRGRRPRDTSDRRCWECGEYGHIQRNCPLNTKRPAQQGDGWPKK